MRELSNGKPIGFKLCIGSRVEILAICKAMIEEKITPDFIIVDGSEGGTGAAPLEYQDHVGTPLVEGIILLHNALVGTGLRDRIKIGAAGKIISGHDIVRHIIQGADFCMSARAMMMAVGCIQAQKCHTNTCPVGVATQDPKLYRALDVDSKGDRVERYHRLTVEEAGQIIATMGCESPEQMTRQMLRRRITATESVSYESLYRWLDRGELFEGVEGGWGEDWDYASADSFTPGHPGKYVYNDRTEFTHEGETTVRREPELATVAQGSSAMGSDVTPEPRHGTAPRLADHELTGTASRQDDRRSSNVGDTKRAEGQPGTEPGAQHTTTSPDETDGHVDPADK